MIYLLTSVPFFVAFGISFARERRRLRNGVYLMIALFFFLIGLMLELMEIPVIDGVLTANLVALGTMFAVLVVLPVFLVANGVLMLRREGRRLGNLLSLIAGLGVFAYVPVMMAVGKTENETLEIVSVAVTLVLGYLSLAFVCFLLSSIVYARAPRRRRVDFVVVLGSRLIRSTVPPLLASRLNRAKALFDAEVGRGGDPLIITSGGQGADEDMPEARAMADYLIAAGVPEERIVTEEESATTEQNLRNSKEIMADRKPGYQSVVVTNNFHAFRAALTARRLGVDGQVVGSRTALYYIPSATIREFAGVLRDHWKINTTVCGLLVGLFVVETIRTG
jgi:uncharacterized SAM-binding protein YcdF (DUF218 family)